MVSFTVENEDLSYKYIIELIRFQYFSTENKDYFLTLLFISVSIVVMHFVPDSTLKRICSV